jgi:membrane protein
MRMPNSRIENLVSWFAASVMTAAAVIYALKLDQDRVKPIPGFSNPTPAQEPLALQQARAPERGRGRRATAPLRIPWLGWKDIFYRT